MKIMTRMCMRVGGSTLPVFGGGYGRR